MICSPLIGEPTNAETPEKKSAKEYTQMPTSRLKDPILKNTKSFLWCWTVLTPDGATF